MPGVLPDIGELRPWTDPEVVSIGRLPMRPPTVAHADIASARLADRTASPWWRPLDGGWRFRLAEHPDKVPAAWVGRGIDDKRWTTLTVPGNWTVQGVGDHPHYTNVQMPFDGPPPRLPDRNPTGVYRRTFTVPRGWRDRRVVLHVGGADSVHAVYVNGGFAGYGTDSRLASEYDITPHLVAGRNDLAIVVVRYSAHSYVEDQDQWWMAGLHREIALVGRGATHVAVAGLRRRVPGRRRRRHARRVGDGRRGRTRRRRVGRCARPSRRSVAAGWRPRSRRRCRTDSPSRMCSVGMSRRAGSSSPASTRGRPSSRPGTG